MASLDALLRPRSVAVIGASRTRGTIGAEIFHNLIAHGFTGAVYPVHPEAHAVQGVRAFPSVTAIPDKIDLAVIVVPAARVSAVIDDCVAAGVGAVLIITAGFAETGEDGKALQDSVLARVRAAGMRMVGPNCLGILNADPAIALDATFAPTWPPHGGVAFSSQSGAVGLAILDYAKELGIGVHQFVSIGNKADVSGNDLIAHWGADPAVNVVLLYLESFGNPINFMRIATEVSRRKPIVAVKAGRTAAGARAASSHTGSLAGLEVAVDALIGQAGVIRTDTIEELFDVAMVLAHQPVPRGGRVAILTNAGGPGIMATDACESHGLTLAELSADTTARLRALLPPEASVKNPVDMIASAGPAAYEQALPLLLADDGVDAVIVLFVPPITVDPSDVGRAIAHAAAGADKPVLSCFMGRQGVPEALSQLQAARIPSYAFPESAVRVLARAARYAEWRARPRGEVVSPNGFDVEAARAAVAAARTSKSGWLSPDDVAAVLAAAGIPTPIARVARSSGEAAELARAMGFPVVLKLVADGIEHKTEVGGVLVDLRDEKDVFTGFETIRASLDAHGLVERMKGVLVQPLIKGGVETVIGMSRDPSYGPLLMFGLGGIHVELMRDVAFRLTPLTDAGAGRQVRSIRGFPLLQGWRGAPPSDVAALEDVLLRVSALSEAIPELAELDLNPVVALPHGCVAVDARIRVSAPPRPPALRARKGG